MQCYMPTARLVQILSDTFADHLVLQKADHFLVLKVNSEKAMLCLNRKLNATFTTIGGVEFAALEDPFLQTASGSILIDHANTDTNPSTEEAADFASLIASL